MATTGSRWEGPGVRIGDDADRGGDAAAEAGDRPARLRGDDREGVSTRSRAARRPSRCPDCDERARRDGCEFVCGGCGLVVAVARLQHGPEWRYDDERPPGRGGRRCNGPPDSASRNPGWGRTRIGTRAERRRAATRAVGFHRLERLQTRAIDYETEVLNHAIPEIKRVCSELDLRGDTVERACGVFRQARAAGFVSHRRIETVAGASVYVACREHRVPRLPADVASAVRVSETDLNGSTTPVDAVLRAFRGMCQADDVSIHPYPLTALDYIPGFASALGVTAATRLRGRAIAERATEAGATPNRAPGCVAGAALDLAIEASDEDEATHVAVAEATGYSVETLREVRQRLDATVAVDSIDVSRVRPG